jgi:hypothetical protein
LYADLFAKVEANGANNMIGKSDAVVALVAYICIIHYMVEAKQIT